MKRLQPSKEILASWRRCMDKGVCSNALSPSLNIKEELLKYKQQENSLLLTIFDDCTSKASNMIDREHIFLLISPEGVLLKKTGNFKKKV